LAISGRAIEVPSRYRPSYIALARIIGKTKSFTNSSRTIVDEDMLGLHTGQLGLGARRLELFALAEIGGEGHHLALIGPAAAISGSRWCPDRPNRRGRRD
jgi:hypothetical protein